MGRFFVCVVLLFTCLNFSYNAYCAVEDTEENIETQLPEKLYKKPQLSQPILPPIIPPTSSGISLTPSPHIPIPPVTPRPITVPSVHTLPKLPKIPKLPVPNLPSVPVHVTVPVTSVSAELPRIPMIRSLIGTVVNISSKEDEGPWIEVKGEFIEQSLKIKVDPQNTAVRKKAEVLSLEDIKTGTIVQVIYTGQGVNLIASFISIMSAEDIEAMKQNLESESPAPQEEKEDAQPK